jgi:lysophospholipase L1-like esterase
LRQGAAIAAVGAVLVAACGEDVERSQRTACGATFDVTVRGDDVEVAGGGPGEWRLTWWPEDGDDLTSVVGPLPLQTDDTGDELARITTPDGACTALVGEEPPAVRVVGDSIAFNVARDGLAPWQGTPGASWVVTSDDPLIAAVDEVRGAVADRPDVLVLQFGDNDALWSVADDTGERRAAVAAAIAATLAETATVPCVRVVTPSAGPTGFFGLGERFTTEAEAVADLLRTAAPGAVIDWTALSADHHLPDGTDGDWFPDGDEIHPNEEGMRALVDLVADAVAQC